MKKYLKHITLVLVIAFVQLNGFCQNVEVNRQRYFSIYSDVSLYDSELYLSKNDKFDSYPEEVFLGYAAGLSLPMQSYNNFHLQLNFGGRYIPGYLTRIYKPDPFNSGYYERQEYKYLGWYFGPQIFLFSKNQLELGFKAGIGNRFESYNDISNPWIVTDEYELAFNIGYRYLGTRGLSWRGGLYFNGQRNRGANPNYAAYLGVGYTWQRNFTKTTFMSKESKKNNEITFSVQPFLFDFNLSLIGIGLNFEHFLYQKGGLKIGYAVLNKIATDTYDNIYSLGVSSIFLLGNGGYSHFEANLGGVVPISSIGDSEFYQYPWVGIGYRYSDELLHLRCGVSTAAIFYVGLGVNIDFKK